MRDSLVKLMPWMGGKGQLMWAIQMLLPIHYKTLVDVFGGSGSKTAPAARPKRPAKSATPKAQISEVRPKEDN